MAALFPNGQPLQSDLEELNNLRKISTLFPQQPPENQLHIIAYLPEGPLTNVSPGAAGMKRQVDETQDPDTSTGRPYKRPRLSYSASRIQSEILADAATPPPSFGNHAAEHDKNNDADKTGTQTGEPLEGLGALFPFQLEYVDLTNLERCNRIPKLVCVRSEFSLLDKLLTQHSPGSQMMYFITGTPGIGKTVFLYLRLLWNLINNTPFLFQNEDGHLFHVSKEVIPMRVDGADFSFGKVDEALIDLDYISKVKEPVATVRQWTGIPTIIATPPNPTISSNWLEQHKNNILTMQNWNSEEFWVTSLFLSEVNISEEKLRCGIVHFGYNPRVCFNALKDFDKEKAVVVTGIRRNANTQQLLDILDPITTPDRSVPHSVFDVVPSTERRGYYNSYLQPQSNWALEQLLEQLQIKDFATKSRFHTTLTGIPLNLGAGMLGKFWESQVHLFFQRLKGSFKANLKALSPNEGEPEVLDWTFEVSHPSVAFGTNELGPQLAPFMNEPSTCYIQPHSQTYPTIHSMIFATTSPGEGLSQLVLFQMVTNEHTFNIKGFEKVQHALAAEEYSHFNLVQNANGR